MSASALRRHDISNRTWELLAAHQPGQTGAWGGVTKNNRLFINAVFRILRIGAPWQDLPPEYGDCKNTHKRFTRWRDKPIWEKLLEQLVTDVDYEWLMIDASHVKDSSTCRGSARGQPGYAAYKRGLNTKLHLAVDAHGMPIRVLVTSGTVADCTQAGKLTQGMTAQNLTKEKQERSTQL